MGTEDLHSQRRFCGPSYGLDLDEAPMAEDQIFEKNGLKVFIDRQTLITLASK